MRTRILLIALLYLVCGLPVSADVTIEEEAKMGGIMKVLTFGRGMKTVTQVSGDKMRTESGDDVQIVDLTEEKIYDLNKKKKTYTVMTFEQMRQQMKAAMEKMKSSGKDQPKQEGQEEVREVSTRADVKVETTDKTQEIQGYSCKQYIMTLDVTMTDQETKEEGTLSTVTELWLTKEAPGVEEVTAFYRKMAEKLGTTEIARGLRSTDNPQAAQFSVAMNEMTAEAKTMDGYAMRTVFHFGSPEAARAEAMKSEEEEEKKGGGFGGFLKKRLPMGGGDEPEEESSQTPQGAVLMKMTVETKKIEVKSINPSAFRVPDDYKLVAPES